MEAIYLPIVVINSFGMAALVDVKADEDNSWLYLDSSLINEDTGAALQIP